jgi:hypothetical protein
VIYGRLIFQDGVKEAFGKWTLICCLILFESTTSWLVAKSCWRIHAAK